MPYIYPIDFGVRQWEIKEEYGFNEPEVQGQSWQIVFFLTSSER